MRAGSYRQSFAYFLKASKISEHKKNRDLILLRPSVRPVYIALHVSVYLFADIVIFAIMRPTLWNRGTYRLVSDSALTALILFLVVFRD